MFHDGFLDDIDPAEVRSCSVPFDIPDIERLIARVLAGRGCGIPVVILFCVVIGVLAEDSAFPPGDVGGCHPVIPSVVDIEASSVRGVGIVVVVPVEPVPPVQMVFSEIRFLPPFGHVPHAGHEQVSLHGRQGPMGPACPTGLTFHRRHIVRAIHISEVIGTGCRE